MFPLFFVFFLVTTQAVTGFRIALYADVYKDVEFFTKTFPWFVDNIGSEITVQYYLVGSGRYSVPQMCALDMLYGNTFLQAQYLNCEAEGNPSKYCLCETGIGPESFRYCVTAGGSRASFAAKGYSELGLDFTPIIVLKQTRTVYGVDDIGYLKEICSLFEENNDIMPRGCVKPLGQNEGFPEKNAIAQFDKVCHKELPMNYDDDKPVVTPKQSEIPTTGFGRKWA